MRAAGRKRVKYTARCVRRTWVRMRALADAEEGKTTRYVLSREASDYRRVVDAQRPRNSSYSVPPHLERFSTILRYSVDRYNLKKKKKKIIQQVGQKFRETWPKRTARVESGYRLAPESREFMSGPIVCRQRTTREPGVSRDKLSPAVGNRSGKAAFAPLKDSNI